MFKKFDKIVLNVPHSSINDWDYGWNNPSQLFPHVKKWTDWFTDILFKPNEDLPVDMVVFPHSRFYVDAERLLCDPLEEKGQGRVYTNFEDCARTINDVDAVILKSSWNYHQANLSECISSDDTLIIDCHSFPNDVCPDVEVNIGFNYDWSKPSNELIEFVKQAFEGAGLTVGINKPYSNSITPDSIYCYRSLMIEINKRIYMNENTLLPNSFSFKALRTFLNNIYKQLLE